MSHQRGFSLIELLIVVAIIGIIAAIAIPSLLRARIAANESGTMSESRTFNSSETTYGNSNSAYGQPSCLSNPPGCGWPANTTPFLDSQLGALLPESGYGRAFFAGIPVTGDFDPAGLATYLYAGTPISLNQTGTRGFGIDHSGLLCFTTDGTIPPNIGGSGLAPGCTPVK